MTNTDHDEALNLADWYGCEWLGVESMWAPKHREPRPDYHMSAMIKMKEEAKK